jgi:hypothetical protein
VEMRWIRKKPSTRRMTTVRSEEPEMERNIVEEPEGEGEEEGEEAPLLKEWAVGVEEEEEEEEEKEEAEDIRRK